MGGYVTKKDFTGSFQTFYCDGGEGNKEAIIFLHGSGPGANAESNWRYILPAFSDRYRVIAPDVYGFGKTDHPEDPKKTFWEWTRLSVEQVLALMDLHGIEKAHLVGNSMGGVISLNCLMTAPERFDKVILMGSGGGETPSTLEVFRMTQYFRDPTLKALENIIRWFVYDDSLLKDNLQEILQERYNELMRPEVRRSYLHRFPAVREEVWIPPSALRRMHHPILLMHGMEDRFVSMESSMSLLKHLPNAQLHIFKQCGHWIQIEKRESFIELVKSFLEDKI